MKMLNKTRLLKATFLLFLVSMSMGFVMDDAGIYTLPKGLEGLGILCCLLAPVLAIFVKGRWLAGLITVLVAIAVVGIGAFGGWMMLFGVFASILGLTWRGMDALGLLGMTLCALLLFTANAWALLRAYDAWMRAKQQAQAAA